MNEVKEKYLKKIYLNILKAIIILFYFFVLNQAYANISSEHFELGIKVLTMVFLFIAIFMFEIAYKKDDDNLAIQGIEILVLSAYTLTSRHITNKFHFDFRTYSIVASYIFAIYFVLKCIVIYTRGRKEEAEELSDIKEIVKKEEPKKKEASKRIKEETLNVKPKTTIPKQKKSVNENTENDGEPKKKTSKNTENDGESKKKTSKKTENDEKTKKKTSKKSESEEKPKKKTSKKTESEEKQKRTTRKKPAEGEVKPKTTARKKPAEVEEKPKKKRTKKETKEND